MTRRGAARWEQLSLRNQLTIVNVVLLALSLIVAGTGTTLLLRPTLVGQTDASLRSIAADPSLVLGREASEGQFSITHVQRAPQPYYVAVLDKYGAKIADNWEGRPDAQAPAIPHPQNGEGPKLFVSETRDASGAAWRVVVATGEEYTTDAPIGRLVIALPMSNVNATMASFLAIFFGFGLSVLIFAAVSTRLLVSATLRPLRRVESTATAFAAGDYDQRLPEATPNTEVGRLSRSLNGMLGRIDSALIERDRTISQMRRFVGDASHELRTPLVTVRGYAELYRMGALNDADKVGQAMDRIEGEALRMGGLVEDLLQLARLDENREMPKDVIDLEPLVEDAAMDTTAQAPDRTVRVFPIRIVADDADAYDPELTAFGQAAQAASLPEPLISVPHGASAAVRPGSAAKSRSTRRRLGRMLPSRRRRSASDKNTVSDTATAAEDALPASQPDTAMPFAEAADPSVVEIPAMVHGNSDKVRQAIQNVLGNALRYTPEGTPLELGVVVDALRDKAIIEIIDHGDGIPEETRKQIFQRFWRADTSRTRETGGSGLGLAIVSAIMQAHDGQVDVVETPGGGATFRLHFPLLTAPPVDNESSTGSSTRPDAD